MSIHKYSRRAFIRKSALASVTMGAAVKGLAGPEDKKTQKNILNRQSGMRYRRLGNTDIYLSAISFGGLVAEESVYHYGIERGVNLMHMSTSYKGGECMRILGNVLKTKRDKVYVAFKDNFDDIDAVLKILNTDYIDFYMINRHAEAEVKQAGLFERFEKYKKAGKVRFAGLTTHKDVNNCVAAAAEREQFSLIMPVLNQTSYDSMTKAIEAVHKSGKGMMAMKTMKGIDDPELETAWLKKMLQDPAVTTVNKGIGSFEMFDRYAAAASEVLTGYEEHNLFEYAQHNRSNNCMMCSTCEKACPDNVEISTVLRCKEYYLEQQNDPHTAREALRELDRAQLGSDACAGCRMCESVCPNNIAIVDRLERARRVFQTWFA